MSESRPKGHDAFRDPATSFFHDEMFRCLLGLEILRALRYRDFFSICIVAIDRDSPSEPNPAPEVMRAVAGAISETIRRTDVIGMLETGLGIILLHVDGKVASTIAERMMNKLRQVALGIEREGFTGPLRVSIGGASFPQDGQTEEALLTQCLRRLEEARRGGGNQVSFY